MATEMNKLADAVSDDECFTIDELAGELGVSVQRARQILTKVKQDKMIPWLVKKSGLANLYTPEFVTKLQELYASGRLGKPRKKDFDKAMVKNAKLLVQVPVFDEQGAAILQKKFGSTEEIQKFLREKLEEAYKPVLKKINELKVKQQRELDEAMSAF